MQAQLLGDAALIAATEKRLTGRKTPAFLVGLGHLKSVKPLQGRLLADAGTPQTRAALLGPVLPSDGPTFTAAAHTVRPRLADVPSLATTTSSSAQRTSATEPQHTRLKTGEAASGKCGLRKTVPIALVARSLNVRTSPQTKTSSRLASPLVGHRAATTGRLMAPAS